MAYENELMLMRYRKEGVCELNEEFTLSDYQTDIRRVLRWNETVLPPSKYIGPDGTDLGGTVNYNILYLGTDNKLYSAAFVGDYGITMRTDDTLVIDEQSDLCFVRAEGITARQLSPRKLSLRGRICAELFAFGNAEKSECMTERFIPDGYEALTDKVQYMNIARTGGEVLELEDEYISELGIDSERVILSEGKVFISEVICSDGNVTVRGELIADILSCNDNGEEIPHLTRRKIPFSKEMECPQSTRDSLAFANGICTEINAQPEESRIAIKAYCLLESTILSSNEETVCLDMYSPQTRISAKENTFRTASPVLCGNGNLSVNGAFNGSDLGLSGSERIICAFGNASAEKLSFAESNGRAVLTGNCRFRIVTVDDTEDIPETDVKEATLPFRYEFNGKAEIPKDPDSLHYSADVKLSRVSARFDGERAGIDAELSVALIAFAEEEHTAVCDAVSGEALIKESNALRIIYPQSGDTLWKIAKETNSKISALCAANGISLPEKASDSRSLECCKYIII